MARKLMVPIGTMSSPPSTRERILAAAMETFMERGFANATTLEIATRARVSKRELYALVGNKEQMLATCIAARGDRMRLPEDFPEPTDRASLEIALRRYGETMLRELSNPGVIAVMRLGIGEAKRSPGIGKSLDAKGRAQARAALEGLLRSAQTARLLADADMEEMVFDFYGLLWGMRLTWILLGVDKVPAPKEIERRAGQAAARFLTIYGFSEKK
jgi:AcrR family transcriptional regulator